MRNRKMQKKQHMDNRGAGLIMVLIMIAFLSILAGMLMFAAYGGYQMKLVDKQNKNNFYTAEMVLDEINVGLQETVSTALTEAYSTVLENYALYESPAKRNQEFYKLYYEKLQMAGALDGNLVTWREDYLSAESKGNGDGTRQKFVDGTATYGAIVESALGTDTYAVELEENKGLLLKEIEVTYVDQMGNVAMISTDIRIAMPKLNFSESSAFPDLNHFSLIADGGLTVTNIFGDGKVLVKGNVYADKMLLDRPAASSPVEITFTPSEEQETNETESQSLVVYRNGIEIIDGKLSTERTELWTDSLLLSSKMAGASVSLDGTTFVKKDLELTGKGSNVTLKGSYTGFGDGIGAGVLESEESSAILVNGMDSTLDLSALENLNISGRAYVGTAYHAIEGETSNPYETNNMKDIMMGESIAVKSDQLVYLVPAEALGCERLADGSIRDSVFRSNPMKVEQYQKVFNDTEKYTMLNTTCPISALGGAKLEDYGVVGYEPVFKYTNAGTLVYCYLAFDKPENANRYFKDYYQINTDKVDKYTRVYADAIKMADDTTLAQLYLAGNALFYNGTTGSVTQASTDAGSAERKEISESLSNMFRAYYTKMVPNLSQLTPGEQSRTVFENIISVEALNTAIDGAQTDSGDPLGDPAVFATTSGKKVILTKNNYEIGNGTDADVQMVVSLGDVTVEKDFTGLILCAGEIKVNGTLDADHQVELRALSTDEFANLLLAKDGSERFYVLNIFRDGVNYANSANKMMDYGTQEVAMTDLIVYEHWSKK